MGKCIGPTSHDPQNTSFILARRNWAERHWVYYRHYPRIFIAPKKPHNAETKCWLGAVSILLLAIWALRTGTYSSLDILQGLNPQPRLHKALAYHSATSASYWHARTRLRDPGCTPGTVWGIHCSRNAQNPKRQASAKVSSNSASTEQLLQWLAPTTLAAVFRRVLNPWSQLHKRQSNHLVTLALHAQRKWGEMEYVYVVWL